MKPRIRTIKPEAFYSEDLASVAVSAVLTFFGLLTLADDAGHVHLVCRQCEQVIQVDQAAVGPLVAALEQSQGFQTDVGHLTVFGLCADFRIA